MGEIKHLINITDLSVEDINHLMETADDIIAHPEDYWNACAHKKLATLFFEPSTRTRLSFTAAMMELGGNVLGFDQAQSSSSAKGETVADTIVMAGCYADIIAMRHPKEGAPVVGSAKSSVPIINAGDGGHFHPTQTLTDLMTIHRKKGEIGNFTVGLCGDLKYGRTVHSLIDALLRYEGIRFVMIAPEELRIPGYIRDRLNDAGVEWCEVESLEDAIPDLDILYMTRIQQERFPSWEEYEKLKDSFILTRAMLKTAREDMIVMHPLPRVNEIDVDVDEDPRACYFYQALMGKYIRMALILYLLGIK